MIKNKSFIDEYEAADFLIKIYRRYLIRYMIVGNRRRGEDSYGCVDIVIVPQGKYAKTIRKAVATDFDIETVGEIWTIHLGAVVAKIVSVSFRSYAQAIFWYTGPAGFIEKACKIAESRGLRITSTAIYRKTASGEEEVRVRSESDIFNLLGMEYLKPAKRRDF